MLEMSGDVFSMPLPPVSNCSFLFSFLLAGSAMQVLFAFPSQYHRLLPFPPGGSFMLVYHRTCCCLSWTSWNQ